MTDEKNGTILTVSRPEDGNWTPAVIDMMNSETAIVAAPNSHWTDGTCLDLAHTKPDGISKDLPARLAQEKIFVSIRGQSIRIAPHLYTTSNHVEKLFTALCDRD